MNTLIANEIIALRALEPADADVIYQWENDTSHWADSDIIAPYSRQMLTEYIAAYNTDIYSQRQLRMMAVLADTGEPVGLVDFSSFDPMNNRSELGLLIAPLVRHRGYGSHILSLALNYAQNHIGLRQLYALIRCDNEASLSLLKKHGFMRSGILEKWIRRGKNYYDVEILQNVFS